jgi:hypothetical protein
MEVMTFKLTIEAGTEAMSDGFDIARALRTAADDIEKRTTAGETLVSTSADIQDADSPGVPVGTWVVAEDSDSEQDEKYREAARKLHHKDGECEIDDGAIVSLSDDGGAYVAAWVWVYDSDAGIEEEEEEDVTAISR